MSLLAKFGGHRFYENGKINFDIIPYVNAWEKAELIASILRIETFSKSRISLYNPEVLDMDGRKKKKKNPGNSKALWMQTQQEEEDRELQGVMLFTQTQ